LPRGCEAARLWWVDYCRRRRAGAAQAAPAPFDRAQQFGKPIADAGRSCAVAPAEPDDPPVVLLALPPDMLPLLPVPELPPMVELLPVPELPLAMLPLLPVVLPPVLLPIRVVVISRT